jgi:cell division inhibitor SepF
MNNIFTKLRDFVGLNEPAEYEYEYEEMDGDAYQNLYQQEQQVQAPPPQEEERPNRRRVRERTVVGSEAGMGSNSMNNVIGCLELSMDFQK